MSISKRVCYKNLWKLLIDRKMKKERLVGVGAYKALLGHRNGQRRSYEYRYPRKDMYALDCRLDNIMKIITKK